MDLSDEDVDTLFVAAPLHDIGKIAIPDSILLKRDRLTDDERRVMQTHCLVGDRMLGDNCGRLHSEYFSIHRSDGDVDDSLIDPVLNVARQIARTHHERWDGKGYPFGLAGEEIPLVGRIVALADVFDALTTTRSYKPAYSLEHSLQIIADEVGKQFDPRVHAAFLTVVPQIVRLGSSLNSAKPGAILR